MAKLLFSDRTKGSKGQTHKSIIVNIALFNDLKVIKKRNNLQSISQVIDLLHGLAMFNDKLSILLKGIK